MKPSADASLRQVGGTWIGQSGYKRPGPMQGRPCGNEEGTGRHSGNGTEAKRVDTDLRGRNVAPITFVTDLF